MNDLIQDIRSAVTVEHLLAAARAALLIGIGLVIARVLSSLVGRMLSDRTEPQAERLARRVIVYGVNALFIAAALHEVGFDLTILLGAAGVLSVAVGFASQTSASNIISGLFLIGERPFGIGDVIQLGGTTGEVLSIDLLSVKLRTYENLFVRIPNETIVKSEVTTLTRFPIRRADVKVGVAYGEDLKRVREVLLDVAERNPLSLEEPAPQLLITGFGSSSVDLQFSVWAAKERYLELKYSIQEQLKEAFDTHDIEIPFPHVSLYSGRHSDPIPVALQSADDGE